MSDLILNLDVTVRPPVKKAPESNAKHQRFVRRRHFLERKGFLKQRQLLANAALPKHDAPGKRPKVDREGTKKRQKLDRQEDHAVQDRKPVLDKSSVSHPKTHPKDNSSGSTRESRPQSSGPPSGKPGGGSLRPNGSQVARKGSEAPRVSLLCEYESSLPLSLEAAKPSKMVAIDCEMVGTGPGGRTSDLARCSVVSYYGDVVYDKYIRPPSPITNYRTRWSGIQRHHMKNAVPFKMAQKEILSILSGKIVIGHAIHNDFKALKYFHPKSLTRDTSKIPLLNRKAGFPENEPASLKRLTKQLLHRDIQVGHNGHSSIEDARATMELYKVIEVEWERNLAASPAQD